ncbi:MAG: U32 family peptidase [Candidatus Latescibacteria bacterium]|nr:U32 family peptidase [Candidatus Latescibacterota bacterium]
MVTGHGVELSAPARNLECGMAAIDCGADAVYIGGPAFGAREAVSNSVADISKLIKYAHKYWVSVYIAINTILFDNEFPNAVSLIEQFYELEADGIIIQDMGLVEYGLPPIPIIASTQTHNTDPEKIRFFEKLGFKRVILARELSLEEIKTIRSAAQKIELECFIHGALCTGYSGQCYLSYSLGGRSGNRGACAQPCRKFYRLVDKDGRKIAANHALSLKDLNLSQHLKALIEAGIDSFKIEGRLKDITYIKNIVSFYRNEIDKVMSGGQRKRTSSGISRIFFKPDPNKTFNRGYTDYFLMARNPEIGSSATPKMVGEYIGSVVKSRSAEITLDSCKVINPGDGICFFDKHGELGGTAVNLVKGNTLSIQSNIQLEAGTSIYRNHDHKFISQVKSAKVIRIIPIRAHFKILPGSLLLSLEDGEGNRIELKADNHFPAAQKAAEAREIILRQLKKTGDSEFECESLSLDAEEIPFIPVSVLNHIRRQGITLLTQARQVSRPVAQGNLRGVDIPWPQKELTYEANVLNKHAEAFYRRHGVQEIEWAAESGTDIRGKKVMTAKYCIKYAHGLCPKTEPPAASGIHHPEPWTLIDNKKRCLSLRFDCARCHMEIFLIKCFFLDLS